MTTLWTEDLFATPKPVIAMVHVPALPGTPRYDELGGVDAIVEHVRSDVRLLVEGGVDAVMFCNEDDRPYMLKAGIEQIAVMTRVVTELAPVEIPYGVDILWDPMAAIAIGHATGASFIREVFTGTYESDMGLWSPNAGAVLRLRRQIGAENIRLFFNVEPEFCSTLGTRSLALRAHSAVVSSLADAILVSGPMAGMEPDLSKLQEVKDATAETPVFLNTGAKPENISRYLSVVDGVIVGSSLKEDGYTWNNVDPERVERFMEEVLTARTRTDL